MPRWVACFLGISDAGDRDRRRGALVRDRRPAARPHDRYGKVQIPGRRTRELPKGEVRLSFQGQASGGGQTRTLEDPPPGLRVRLTSRGGGQRKVEDVPSSLYGVLSGDRGHEPYGKVDVPERGAYRLRTSAKEASAGGEITARSARA